MKSESEIFSELRVLCTSPGYVHALASLMFEETYVRMDGELGASDWAAKLAPERLIRNELNVLHGLLLSAPIDYLLPPTETLDEYKEQSHTLLEELHRAIGAPMSIQGEISDPMKVAADLKSRLSKGAVLREPIFYSGESAYYFQYRDLAELKYSADAEWFSATKGFALEDAVLVLQAIAKLQHERLEALMFGLVHFEMQIDSMLYAYVFSIEDLATETGLGKTLLSAIVGAFASAEGGVTPMMSIDDFNPVSATPIFRYDEAYIVFQTNSLFEALYESPFFWMLQDAAYKTTALNHRGSFAEAFSYERLVAVFGAERVFMNVLLPRSSGETAGEIDVLVLIGDRAIVLQAKSKRLTLAARRGNDTAIKKDFQLAIQDASDQAFDCASLLLDSPQPWLKQSDGTSIPKLRLSQVYTICTVSDHYPALSFQSRQFLQTQQDQRISKPYVIDVFTLDVLAEFLDRPLYFLSFIDRRTGYDDAIAAGQELTVIAHHLSTNLWLSEDYDRMMLDDSLTLSMDIAMTVRREGLEGERTPEGILNRFVGTPFDELLANLEETTGGDAIKVAFLILSLNPEGVDQLNLGLRTMYLRCEQDGLPHDFSIGLGDSGVTIHASMQDPMTARDVLREHVDRRIQRSQAETWLGVCVSPSNHKIRIVLHRSASSQRA